MPIGHTQLPFSELSLFRCPQHTQCRRLLIYPVDAFCQEVLQPRCPWSQRARKFHALGKIWRPFFWGPLWHQTLLVKHFIHWNEHRSRLTCLMSKCALMKVDALYRLHFLTITSITYGNPFHPGIFSFTPEGSCFHCSGPCGCSRTISSSQAWTANHRVRIQSQLSLQTSLSSSSVRSPRPKRSWPYHVRTTRGPSSSSWDRSRQTLTYLQGGPARRTSISSTQLCVGFLFLILYPSRSSSSSARSSSAPPSFTRHLCHPLTHNLVNHHLSHTIFVNHHLSHTSLSTHHLPHLCQPPSFTRNLSHTTRQPTHTQLCQPPSFKPSFTPIFVNHHLSHTTWSIVKHIFVTHHLSHLCQPTSFIPIFVNHHLSHTTLSIVNNHLLCLAGLALSDIHLRFAWQAWHLVTSTFVLRGKQGMYGTGLALVARLGRF